jgi:hypothetical protein
VLEQLKIGGLISLSEWRKGYNAFEIDDILLGPLDDVGRFEKNGLLDIRTAYNTFGYYVRELVGHNKAVKDFLKDKGSQGNYDDLEYLYREFVSYEEMKTKCWCTRRLWAMGHMIRRRRANGIGIHRGNFGKPKTHGKKGK